MDALELSDNARKVLRARYLRRNRARKLVETPEALFERVAAAVSEPELVYGGQRDAEKWRDEFFEMMTALEFLPNTPTLMNAGTAMNQLSACFVLPVGDSIEEIFEAVKQMAMVQRSGGGTGFSFSRLRPRGDFISSTGGRSSGPVSFMEIFDCTTANIRQGGKRRGANMGVLRASHPDILDFVEAKRREGAFESFNLSVLVDDDFMEAACSGGEYPLLHPRDGGAIGRKSAGEVFAAICRSAWETGDPGLLFDDAVNRDNPTPRLGRIDATNPCGEIPLLDYESCNLGSINLSRMLRDGDSRIDWEKLKRTVRKAVRFLDNVIDVSRYPIPQIEKTTRANRKIGLGVMGFAEMLIRMGIAYDGDEGVDRASAVMETIHQEAFRASCRLAEIRGVYPNWKDSVHRKRGKEPRNATVTAVAPTGTISIIAGTTPSIEPVFALAYRRSHVLEESTLDEVSPLFRSHAESRGLDPDRLLKQARRHGGLAQVEEAPDDLKRVFRTALEIPPAGHLRIQAAFQRHVDNSVSKTVNMAEDTAPADVADVYRKAWEEGLKGITVYRYGSRPRQVLEV